MSTPEALSPRGSGIRQRMAPAQRKAWIERLADSAEAVQQAVAALENDVDEALHDGCHITWIAAITGVHYRVIQRIRDKGPARSWRHPSARPTHGPDILDEGPVMAGAGVDAVPGNAA